MKYVMENHAEALRLEKQSLQNAYSLQDELRNLSANKGELILDAGCGTGLVSRFMMDRLPETRIEACDGSDLRLQQAKKLCQNDPYSKIRFFRSDLEKVEAPNSTYDQIVCRYVYEHLKDQTPVSQEFLRVLKPGGKLTVIDFDGLFYNLHHSDPKLAQMIQSMQSRLGLDLWVGRKIPLILTQAGFEQVEWRVTVHSFQGESLEAEREMVHERISLALPVFAKVFGSQQMAVEFRERYCSAMMQPGTSLFYNKFIVEGRKGRLTK